MRIVQDPAQLNGLHSLMGPYCHQSRNLLNGLKIAMYIARSRERSCGERSGGGPEWEDLDRLYQAVEQRFDRLQTICRPMIVTLVRLPFSLLVEERRGTWVDRFSSRERVLDLIAPEPGEDGGGDYDPNSLGLALDAFVLWRAEAGMKGQGAQFRWWTRRGRIHLEWVESPRKSTQRARAVTADGLSTPLALPLLIRVITAHGGSFERIDPDGRRLRLSWPQIHRSPESS